MALPPDCKRISASQRLIASQSIRTTTKDFPDSNEPHFAIYHDSFLDILGPTPSLKCIAQKDYMFAHEAPVWIPEQDAIYFTSNTLRKPGPVIEINKIAREKGSGEWTFEHLDSAGVVMGNGAINYPQGGGILFCDQGNLEHAGGLVVMQTERPYRVTKTLVDSFHGRLFNSVNDVVVSSKDGSIWWTDPMYGWEQGFRGEPQMPSLVYRLEPETGDIRVVADGLVKPNGLCFSPDEGTMYVTDTECYHGTGTKDFSKASTMWVSWERERSDYVLMLANRYAFDVIERLGGRFLANKRVFALADSGIPDGIKCDTQGFVYSGCGDGVQVWHANGTLVGKIVTPGCVANFCFTKKGEMILLNEFRIWEVKINPQREGALLANMGISVA